MISRRPNSRASIEYAPGPRMARAKSIANPKINPSRESKPPEEQIGRTLNAVSIATIPPPIPANVVRRPTKRRPPLESPKHWQCRRRVCPPPQADRRRHESATSSRRSSGVIKAQFPVDPWEMNNSSVATTISPILSKVLLVPANYSLSGRRTMRIPKVCDITITRSRYRLDNPAPRASFITTNEAYTASAPGVNPKLLDVVMIRKDRSRILGVEE